MPTLDVWFTVKRYLAPWTFPGSLWDFLVVINSFRLLMYFSGLLCIFWVALNLRMISFRVMKKFTGHCGFENCIICISRWLHRNSCVVVTTFQAPYNFFWVAVKFFRVVVYLKMVSFWSLDTTLWNSGLEFVMKRFLVHCTFSRVVVKISGTLWIVFGSLWSFLIVVNLIKAPFWSSDCYPWICGLLWTVFFGSF